MIITFHMKSGRDIKVEADKMEIKKQNGNELIGWTIEGRKDPGADFYIRIDEVEAITYKE
jgi:hypothetical protein